jgi:hypothetical protein
MENFFLRFNGEKIKSLMTEINKRLVNCKCMACYETGRTTDAPFGQAEARTCIFVPAWEDILKKYQVRFEYEPIPDGQTEEEFMDSITTHSMGPRYMLETDIVNIGPDDLWRNVALGRGVGRTDNRPYTVPRNKLRFLFK